MVRASDVRSILDHVVGGEYEATDALTTDTLELHGAALSSELDGAMAKPAG